MMSPNKVAIHSWNASSRSGIVLCFGDLEGSKKISPYSPNPPQRKIKGRKPYIRKIYVKHANHRQGITSNNHVYVVN